MHSPRPTHFLSSLAALALPLLPLPGAAQQGPVEIPAFLTLNKSAAYVQSVSGEVTLLGDTPHSVLGIALGAPDILSLTNVVLSLPSGETESLDYRPGDPLPFPGWDLSFPYATQALIDSDYPAGNYLYTFDYDVLGAAKGTVRVPLAFPGDRTPPTPALLNLSAAQHFCAGADFILEAVSFTGATELDQVTAQVSTATDEPAILFSTNVVPNSVGPVQLRLPANTLQPNTDYVLRLVYDRIAGVGLTNTTLLGGAAVLAVTARSSHSRVTRVPLHTESCPRLQIAARNDAGILRLRFDTIPGGQYDFQASSNLVTWQTLLTTNATASTLELTPNPSPGEGSQFYRIRRP